MSHQQTESTARQMLGGCERALGREVTVHGPQVAAIYLRAKELDPTLPIDEEIKRFQEGGQLVHVFADHCADVCRVVVSHADAQLDEAAAGGDAKAAKKKADAEAKANEKQAKLDLKKIAADQKKAAGKKKGDAPADPPAGDGEAAAATTEETKTAAEG